MPEVLDLKLLSKATEVKFICQRAYIKKKKCIGALYI